MKRFLSLKMFLLAAFALVAGTMNAGEKTTTITLSSSYEAGTKYTSDDVTWTMSKGSGSNDPKWYDNGSALRVYKNNTITFSVPDGCTLTKIVFTVSTSNNLSAGTGTLKDNTWTPADDATTSITFTNGNSQSRFTKFTVTYSTGDSSKEDATAQWSDAAGNAISSFSVKQKEWESATFPTFSHTGDATTVTYTSSDETVATIAEDGTVTVLAAGATTIKGHVDATDKYNAASASYELLVIGDNSFVRPSIIIPGRTYAIIASGSHALTTKNSSKDFGDYTTKVSVSGSTALVNDAAAKLTIELVSGTTDHYLMKVSDGTYCYYKGSDNELYFTSDVSTATTNYWTIELGSSSDTFIPGTATGRKLQYNSSASRFACYTSSQGAVTLYILESDNYVDVTIGSLGYASLYYGEANLQVPSGVTALTVDASNITDGANGKEIATTAYKASDDAAVSIAKGTAVFIKGEPGDYQFPVLSETTGTVVEAVDCIKGTDVADSIAAGDGNYVYCLSSITNDQGENIAGFYWYAGSGGTYCKLPAHKACIILNDKAVSGVRSLTFGNGETTGVSQVTGHGSQVTNIFDLQGRKLSKMQRGVNIVNGKKIIVR